MGIPHGMLESRRQRVVGGAASSRTGGLPAPSQQEGAVKLRVDQGVSRNGRGGAGNKMGASKSRRCRTMHEAPRFTVAITVKIPEDLRDALQAEADEAGMQRSDFTRILLREGLKAYRERRAPVREGCQHTSGVA